MTDTARLATLVAELKQVCAELGLVYHIEIINPTGAGEAPDGLDATTTDPCAEHAHALAEQIVNSL